MSTKNVPFNKEILLSPIHPEKPAGDWLRYDSLFDEINEARREEDGDDTGDWALNNRKRANWILVRNLCLKAIETRSKDITLCCWLCEAMVQTDGWEGLAQSAELLFELTTNFWESAFPSLESGIEARVAPFVWLDNRLSMWLKILPISDNNALGFEACTYADYERLNLPGKSLSKEPSPQSTKKIVNTSTELRHCLAITPAVFIQATIERIHLIMRSLISLEEYIDQKIPHAVSFRTSRILLQDISDVLSSHTSKKIASSSSAPSNSQGMNNSGYKFSEKPKKEKRKADNSRSCEAIASEEVEEEIIKSRAEAYRRIAEAADFLERLEPHSPVPYLLRRAISWGGLPLPNLLQELIKEESEQHQIFSLLAISDKAASGAWPSPGNHSSQMANSSDDDDE